MKSRVKKKIIRKVYQRPGLHEVVTLGHINVPLHYLKADDLWLASTVAKWRERNPMVLFRNTK